MKGEVVEVNNKYAARVKKWYSLRWKYIGITYLHSEDNVGNCYILCDTYDDALERLRRVLPIIKTINK